MGQKKKNRAQPPIKGFRPGKEPPQLIRQRAKARLGDDAGWAQEKMIDAVAGRSPREVEAIMNRWTTVLLVGTVVLALLGALLYRWSVAAGIAVHVLALGTAFFWFRLRRQRARLVELAESLGGGSRK